MNSINDVFLAVKDGFCKEKIVEASYNLFIRPLEIKSLEGNTAVLLTNNEWAKGVIEERFEPYLRKGYEEILGFTVLINIEVKKDEETSQPAAPINGGKYALTFDTFIVGSSNKFAHAAALAVAQNPATA